MATETSENAAFLQEETRSDYGSLGQPQPTSQLPRFSDVLRSHLRQDANDHDFSDVVFPRFWESMRRKTVIGVHLDLKSEEAREVARLFHHNTAPKKITRILRIQNPRLWAHYYRKRQQMQRDHGGETVLEYRLFHGTEARKVDSICRKGFEVGRSGSSHGNYLGKGIYFATDSLWAGVYSLCSISQRRPQILTSPLVTFASMDTREFSEINYNLGWHYANPLISSLECSGSEGDEIHFYNQREEDSAQSEDACENETKKAKNSTALRWQLAILTDRLVRPLVPGKVLRKAITVPASTQKTAQTMPVTFAGASTREESKPTTTDLSSRPAAQNQDTVVGVEGDEDRASNSPVIAATATTQPRAASATVTTETDGITSHLRYMFLCSVLVGSTVLGQEDFIMPPLMDAGNPDSPRHDSCYGWMPCYLEFVVFRNNQAYPEYLIEYSQEEEPVITTRQQNAAIACLVLVVFVCVFVIVMTLHTQFD